MTRSGIIAGSVMALLFSALAGVPSASAQERTVQAATVQGATTQALRPLHESTRLTLPESARSVRPAPDPPVGAADPVTTPNPAFTPPLTGGPASGPNGAPTDTLTPPDVTADAAGSAPQPSVSRYVRNLTGKHTAAQIISIMDPEGCTDASRATSATAHLSLLQFGAQSNRAGGTGDGTGTATGVRLSATKMRITDAQVVKAVQAYLAGYARCRPVTATGKATVVVGTSTAGYHGATFTPAAKAKDWAAGVLLPIIATAPAGITVVAGNDIEPDFDARLPEVKTWITTYLAQSASLRLINNGAASGCPATLGTTGRTCLPVPIQEWPGATNTWAQADYFALSGGLAPGRISVLPQIYVAAQARQWENIDRTGITNGVSPLVFAGSLTEAAATPGASYPPTQGWKALVSALASSPATITTKVPTATDLRIDT